jgi:hypothetical protein
MRNDPRRRSFAGTARGTAADEDRAVSKRNQPRTALDLKNTIARIPNNSRAAITRVQMRFTGRNKRFAELEFLSPAGSVIFTLTISKTQTWNLADWLLDESVFPRVPARGRRRSD